MVLAFAFVSIVRFDPVTIDDVLLASLTRSKFGGGPSHLIAIVILPTWIGAVFAFTSEQFRPIGGNRWKSAFFAGALVSGVIGALCAVAKAAQISAISRVSNSLAPGAAALAQGRRYEVICIGLMALCLLVLAVWGWSLCAAEGAAPRRATRRELVTGSAMMAVAVLLSWFACVNPVRADALAGLANALNSAARLPAAVEAYRRALGVNANSSAYRFELAQLLMALAENSTDRASFEANMRSAETMEEEGLQISSLDQQGALMLGQVYERWAAQEDNPDRRLALAKEACRFLEEAQAFKPVEEYALVDLAAVEANSLGDPTGSASALAKADTLVR